MLEIKGLSKDSNHTKINNINLTIPEGTIVSIECSIEMSNLLIDLILGKSIPSKGEILIDGQRNYEYFKRNLGNTGVVFSTEGFYERMTVDEYLKFYSELLGSSIEYKEVMMKLGLLDIGNRKIGTLSMSQRKRLSFAREKLKDIRIFFFQEPLSNIDKDSTRILMENIEELRESGALVICTSVSFKDALLIGGEIYSLDENGLKEIEHDNIEKESSNYSLVNAVHRIEKIPAKIDDTILLFNPIEIEYIESENSVSYLNVRGERFTCNMTLNELENRLEHLGFFRCHRSYLVNLQKVREMIPWSKNSYSLILDDKKKSSIPLSKGRIEELKKILNL